MPPEGEYRSLLATRAHCSGCCTRAPVLLPRLLCLKLRCWTRAG